MYTQTYLYITYPHIHQHFVYNMVDCRAYLLFSTQEIVTRITTPPPNKYKSTNFRSKHHIRLAFHAVRIHAVNPQFNVVVLIK